jgi:hypothetical protein
MRGLRLRYRRDIFCTGMDCSQRLAGEGETSDALYPDGSTVTTPGFSFQNSSFELTCKVGHQTIVFFPKDVMLLKTAVVEGDQTGPPAVLRR